MEINYLGLLDEKFKYRVTLNGHNFDYFTGIGWSILSKKRPNGYFYDCDAETKLLDSNHLLKNQWRQSFSNRVYIKLPSENDVLECLKNDSDAGSMSFDDFCDNFGYSNDSLKALDIYRTCQETTRKMRGYEWPKNLGE